MNCLSSTAIEGKTLLNI